MANYWGYRSPTPCNEGGFGRNTRVRVAGQDSRREVRGGARRRDRRLEREAIRRSRIAQNARHPLAERGLALERVGEELHAYRVRRNFAELDRDAKHPRKVVAARRPLFD